jgi:hypothetical protein
MAALTLAMVVGADVPAPAQPAVTRTGHVYIFRGYADVFSLGMDDLADELIAAGFKVTLHNHIWARATAREAAAEYAATKGRDPIFVTGHSLGADAVITFADELWKHGTPVKLAMPVDTYDPTPVPPNIETVINYHQYEDPGSTNVKLATTPSFRGKMIIFDVTRHFGPHLDHFNIEESPQLHAHIINEIVQRTKPLR